MSSKPIGLVPQAAVAAGAVHEVYKVLPETVLAQIKTLAFTVIEGFFPKLASLEDYRVDPKVLAGVLLAFLDIFKLRKFLFLSKRKIDAYLPHLTANVGFPAHYPSFLQVYAEDKHRNLLYLSHRSIRQIWAEYPRLYQDHSPHLVVSEGFFNQLLQITTLESLLQTLLAVFVSPITMAPGKHQGYQNQMHSRSPVEAKYGIWHQSTSVPFTNRATCWLNYSVYPAVRPDPRSKVALLEAAEFSGKIHPAIYIVSLTDYPVKDDRISTLLLSSFYRLAIVKGAGKEMFPFVATSKFHYFLSKKEKAKYLVKGTLSADHINTAGMYRLGRDVELPVEIVEKIQFEFNAENYTKSMLGTRGTQHFLDDFDGHGLLKILESIPNFTYKFSLAQRELISTHHNSVVVGRSGTGKTTCAVMRMIGIRLLEVAKKNLRKGIHKIRYEDLCEGRRYSNR